MKPLIKEHIRLIKILEKGDKKALKKEAQIQKKELRELMRGLKK